VPLDEWRLDDEAAIAAVRARLFVVSGPSGVGKGTLIASALERLDGVAVATSATTRPRRPAEVDGREYHFLTPAEFQRRVEQGEFLEHVDYAGHRYGTLRSEVAGRLDRGESVLLEVEVAGARAIERLVPDAVLVFIAPPSPSALEERLRSRKANTEAEIADRMRIAREELDAAPAFDHLIVNDRADRATGELIEIIRTSLEEEDRT
jgi:guanylate kinase